MLINIIKKYKHLQLFLKYKFYNLKKYIYNYNKYYDKITPHNNITFSKYFEV